MGRAPRPLRMFPRQDPDVRWLVVHCRDQRDSSSSRAIYPKPAGTNSLPSAAAQATEMHGQSLAFAGEIAARGDPIQLPESLSWIRLHLGDCEGNCAVCGLLQNLWVVERHLADIRRRVAGVCLRCGRRSAVGFGDEMVRDRRVDDIGGCCLRHVARHAIFTIGVTAFARKPGNRVPMAGSADGICLSDRLFARQRQMRIVTRDAGKRFPLSLRTYADFARR